MNYQKKTYFRNRYSLKKLKEFQSSVEAYFKIVIKDNRAQMSESEKIELKNLRTKINNLLYVVKQIVIDANVSRMTMAYDGHGDTVKVDVLDHIFSLEFSIHHQSVIDLIEQTIGVYSHDETSSIIRTLNPMFWGIQFMDFFVDIPFHLLQKSGFDMGEMEGSSNYKILKVIIYIISIILPILAIWNKWFN